MALVLEDGGKVWQKVRQALTNAGPEAQSVFKGLKEFIVSQKGNINLQFIPYTAELAVTDHGTDLVGAACTVYGFYAKGRRTTLVASSLPPSPVSSTATSQRRSAKYWKAMELSASK